MEIIYEDQFEDEELEMNVVNAEASMAPEDLVSQQDASASSDDTSVAPGIPVFPHDLIPHHLRGIPLKAMKKGQLDEIPFELLTKEQLLTRDIPLTRLSIDKLRAICREKKWKIPRTCRCNSPDSDPSPDPEPLQILSREERRQLQLRKASGNWRTKENNRERKSAKNRELYQRKASKINAQEKQRRKENPEKVEAKNALLREEYAHMQELHRQEKGDRIAIQAILKQEAASNNRHL
ncbi:MAG: hypothetical protein SGARI_005245 [Bacillariaceae sp.]